MTRTRVFVLCAAADAGYLAELRTQLAGAGDAVELWDESCIEPGARRQDEIAAARDSAPLALLFVSPDLLASADVIARDLPALARRLDSGQVRVLCLHARPSLLGKPVSLGPLHDRLAELRPLNEPAHPLSALNKHERETALADAAGTMLRLINDGGTTDRRDYLERLRDATLRLELHGMRAERAEHLELEHVYTRLRVTGPAASADERAQKGALAAREPARDGELHELLGEHPCLALVGPPGSGKSTFLQFVALNLARACLDEDRDACLARLGLTGDPLLPILVRLADFARFLEAPGAAALPADCAELFYRFLDQPAPRLPLHLPGSFRRRRLVSGGCLLLLDGLDEVPGEATRARVSQIIGEVVADGRRAGNRCIVTCRTRAYEGRTRLGPEFTRALLVDFGEEEVATFVRQWSRALFAGQPHEAEAHAGDLTRAIRAHPHVQPLTRNPLLLTILAVVHWDRKQLPEQRAELYEAAVDLLLKSRPDDDGGVTERRHGLQALALRFFTDPAGVRRTLERYEAVEEIAAALEMDERAADHFVSHEELHSGLLISRSEGEVEFSHLTFGEYLAALELAGRGREGWEVLRPHVFDPAWSEVVLLLAGCQWRRGRNLVPKLIDDILALGDGLTDRARQVGLIGRILRDVRVRAEGRDPSAKTGYAAALREVLAAFEPGSTVPESVRIEVGEALGQAGDPRIHDNDHENRVFIEGGAFWMGAQANADGEPGYEPEADDDEQCVHRVRLSDFSIDRYPVTVSRFQRFVDAGVEGYRAQRFWSAEGWRWRKHRKRTEPDSWADQLLHANRPVVGVSWYEAEAYCAWLTARSGRHVSLPTETQWEYVARGGTGREYPWGGAAPTGQHMNFDSRSDHPTPVGIYPFGATPDGVHDMAGNVWEWCCDWYGKYEAVAEADPSGPKGGIARVLRGGGFSSVARNCRAASRNHGHPENGHAFVGFRCVWPWEDGHD